MPVALSNRCRRFGERPKRDALASPMPRLLVDAYEHVAALDLEPEETVRADRQNRIDHPAQASAPSPADGRATSSGRMPSTTSSRRA